MTDETESWLEPSPVGTEYMRHEAAMAPAGRVPVHKAFGLAAGFNVAFLRALADTFRPKKIAVIEHGENGFEVRRLADNADLRLFYRSIDERNKLNEIADSSIERIDIIKKTIKQFYQTGDAELAKYDPKAVAAKKEGCITHAYLSRRLANVAAFRKSDDGSGEALKAAIALCDALTKLSKEETREEFGNDAAYYRIDHSKL